METTVFAETSFSRRRYAVGLVWLALLIVGCAGGAAYRGSTAAALGIVLVGGLSMLVLIRQALHTAHRVVVSDYGIEGLGLFKTRPVFLRWQDIDEIQRFVKSTMQGPVVFVRMRSSGHKAQIVVHERLPGFPRLYDFVRQRVPLARYTSASLFERLQWL